MFDDDGLDDEDGTGSVDIFKSVGGDDPPGRRPTRQDRQLPRLPGVFAKCKHGEGIKAMKNQKAKGKR